MQTSDRNWQLGLTLSLLPSLLWGILTITLKLLPDMDAVTITWYRFVVATMFFWLMLRRRGTVPPLSKLRGPSLRLMLIAVAGLCGNFVVFLMGLKQESVTPDAAQVLIQLAPILTLVGSVVIFKESFRPAQWFGFVVFVAGLVLFFHHRLPELQRGGGSFATGIVLIIVGAVIWAAYALAQRQLLRLQWTPMQILFVIYLAGSVLLLPAARPSQLLSLNPLQLGMLFFACFNSIAAYGFFAQAQTHWESSKVSAVLTLTPLFTLAFSQLAPVVLPGYHHLEPIDVLSLVGALMVVVGSMRAVVGRSSKKNVKVDN